MRQVRHLDANDVGPRTDDSMRRYFLPKKWERGGQTYARWGIRRIRPFVAGGRFWQRLRIGPRAPAWKRSTVSRYVRESMVAEAAHGASFLFLLVISVLFARRNDWLPAVAVLLANVMLNVLPVGVLRYNRGRLLVHRAGLNSSSKPRPPGGAA